jgi:serine/threonine protein kinase
VAVLAYARVIVSVEPSAGTVLGGEVRIVKDAGDHYEAQRVHDDSRCFVRWFPLAAVPDEALLESLAADISYTQGGFCPVLVTGYDEPTGGFYIGFAPAKGSSLAALVHERGALAPEVVAAVACRVADTLLRVYELSLIERNEVLVHGALRPESVFVLEGAETTLLTGLGEARLLRLGPPWKRPPAMIVPPPWVYPGWAAPEQFHEDGEVGPEADVFTLALLTFFALTGHSVWPERQRLGAFLGVAPAPQVRAAELGLGHVITPELGRLLAGAMHIDPAKRTGLSDLRRELGGLFGIDAPKAHAPSASPSPAAATAPALAVGALVGDRYELARAVGDGKFLAVERATEQPCFLQLFEARASDATRAAARIEAAKRIESEHLAVLLDAGVDRASGRLFVVTERLGPSLWDQLERSGPLPLHEVHALLVQVAHGLQAAHALGFVHGLLGPREIRRAPGDGPPRWKVAGISSRASLLSGREGASVVSLGWSAPELLADETATPKADVFSLALVVFCAVTGAQLFEGEGPEVMRKVLIEPLPSPRSVASSRGRAQLSVELDRALARAILRTPSERSTLEDFCREALAALDPDEAAILRRRDELIGSADPEAIASRRRRHEAIVRELLGEPPEPGEGLSRPCLTVLVPDSERVPGSSQTCLSMAARPTTCLSVGRSPQDYARERALRAARRWRELRPYLIGLGVGLSLAALAWLALRG